MIPIRFHFDFFSQFISFSPTDPSKLILRISKAIDSSGIPIKYLSINRLGPTNKAHAIFQ